MNVAELMHGVAAAKLGWQQRNLHPDPVTHGRLIAKYTRQLFCRHKAFDEESEPPESWQQMEYQCADCEIKIDIVGSV